MGVEWLAPLVGGGLEFGGEVYANAQALKRQREMQEWQAGMANTAYQRATADMKAAGLNPMMMFGSGSAATTPNVQPAPVHNPGKGLSTSVAEAIRLRNETKLADAQAAKTEAETSLRGEEVKKVPEEIKELVARVAELGSRSDLNRASARSLLADIPRKDATNVLLKEFADAVRQVVHGVKEPPKGKAPFEDPVQKLLDRVLGDAAKKAEDNATSARDRMDKGRQYKPNQEAVEKAEKRQIGY